VKHRPRGPASWRRWQIDDLYLAVMLGLLAFLLAVSGWTWRLDRVIYDLGLATWTRPVPEGITVIAIDDAQHRRHRPLALVAQRACHLLERLAEARSRAPWCWTWC
jgi:CHASE2 domain-containing sensor protein